VINNGLVRFAQADIGIYGGAISGTGSLEKTGAGTTILTASNTYSGMTTITTGALQLGNGGTTGSIVGAVNNNGTLAFNRSDAITFPGVISGSGSVNQIGTGATILTANNTYTGLTTVAAGRLQLGNGGTTGSIVGAVNNNGTLAFNRSDVVTYGGVVSGTGSLAQAGSGTLILSADHNYTGGTAISAGTLQIGNGGTKGSVLGNIANNAALTFNRSDDVTYGGVISGTGSLTQAGSGQLTLTGSNTFTGGTTVNAGLLTVNGSLASGVNVLGGGRLGGTGTIGGNVSVSGTISPGNSIGTINIVGNYVQNPGSTYQVELNASGQSDLISVTGNATINGGTVVAQAGSVARNATYTIVKATGSVASAYTGLSSNFAFLIPSLSYDPHNVYLTFRTAFAGGAQSGNQKAVGAALDQVSPLATGDLDTVVNPWPTSTRSKACRRWRRSAAIRMPTSAP